MKLDTMSLPTNVGVTLFTIYSSEENMQYGAAGQLLVCHYWEIYRDLVPKLAIARLCPANIFYANRNSPGLVGGIPLKSVEKQFS